MVIQPTHDRRSFRHLNRHAWNTRPRSSRDKCFNSGSECIVQYSRIWILISERWTAFSSYRVASRRNAWTSYTILATARHSILRRLVEDGDRGPRSLVCFPITTGHRNGRGTCQTSVGRPVIKPTHPLLIADKWRPARDPLRTATQRRRTRPRPPCEIRSRPATVRKSARTNDR